MVLKGPGARAGGWGETRAPSLILPTPSVRRVSLCLGGRLLLQRFALLLSHPPFYACFSSERTSCTSLAYPWRDWFNFTANRCIRRESEKNSSRKPVHPVYAACCMSIRPVLGAVALSKTLIKHCQRREIGSVSSGSLGRTKVPAQPAGAGCR